MAYIGFGRVYFPGKQGPFETSAGRFLMLPGLTETRERFEGRVGLQVGKHFLFSTKSTKKINFVSSVVNFFIERSWRNISQLHY